MAHAFRTGLCWNSRKWLPAPHHRLHGALWRCAHLNLLSAAEILTKLCFIVSLGQLIGAISPNIQVRRIFCGSSCFILTDCSSDCCSVQSFPWVDSRHVLRCDHTVLDYVTFLEVLAVPTGALHADAQCNALNGTSVSFQLIARKSATKHSSSAVVSSLPARQMSSTSSTLHPVRLVLSGREPSSALSVATSTTPTTRPVVDTANILSATSTLVR